MDTKTKTQKVKEYLEAGNYITDAKAVELCRSYRLSSIIFELRHTHGMNIQDRWRETETSRYKEYYLSNVKR